MNKKTIKIDLGTKSIQTGIFKNNDETFTAMTWTKSKDFKTKKGAERWLEKNTNN